MTKGGAAQSWQAGYCPECGNLMEPGAKSCEHCGEGTALRISVGPSFDRRLLPVIGGLLIIAGAVFNIVTAWYVSEVQSGLGRYIILSSQHFTLAFSLLIGALGFVAGVGGVAAVVRRDYSTAFIGGIASCFSLGGLVGLAGLLMVAVSRDRFTGYVGNLPEPTTSSGTEPDGLPKTDSAGDGALVRREA